MIPIKVLIIDDSAVMRAVLREIIDGAGDMQVVGCAPDPMAAREMIRTLEPDVLTLDVEMPKMNGIEFLRRLMKLRPMPVLMISSLTEKESQITLEALELGAVDFLPKPTGNSIHALQQSAEEIRDKIRAACGARVRALREAPKPSNVAQSSKVGKALDARVTPAAWTAQHDSNRLIAIGASTGGTEAIREVLVGFPADMPGIVIVQHMPESFTGSFARRLDGLSRIHVKEAVHNERILPGTAYLAPGHSHLSVRRSGGAYYTELAQTDPVNRHRPSVDVLFHSVATVAAQHAVGVILTGMGKDGALGMLAMRGAGAWTIAQDQASCVVYGMPREAVAAGAVDESLPLTAIAGRVLTRLLAPVVVPVSAR